MTPKVVSKKEAKEAGLKHYFTGKLCCRGHLMERRVNGGGCVGCMKEIGFAWRKDNPERCLVLSREWGRAHPDRKAAWRKANPMRHAALTAAWYQANKDRRREKAKAWAAANPEKVRAMWRNYRARKASAGGNHSGDDIVVILKMQRHRCADCRVSLKRIQWEVDHIIAVSRGGHNGRSNLQVLCLPCNRKKGARDPIDHARMLGRLL